MGHVRLYNNNELFLVKIYNITFFQITISEANITVMHCRVLRYWGQTNYSGDSRGCWRSLPSVGERSGVIAGVRPLYSAIPRLASLCSGGRAWNRYARPSSCQLYHYLYFSGVFLNPQFSTGERGYFPICHFTHYWDNNLDWEKINNNIDSFNKLYTINI